MDLYVVRHAIAEPRIAVRTEDDAGRPLTPDGIKRFRAAARGLRSLDIDVETVLASRFARAWSTAEILHDDARWPAPEACKELEPEADPHASVAAIAARPESSLAVVGHEPHLSQLVSVLVAGEADAMAMELKKGGAVYVEIAGAVQPGAGMLRWSVSPKILRRLGR